jgi:hypothetical protein
VLVFLPVLSFAGLLFLLMRFIAQVCVPCFFEGITVAFVSDFFIAIAVRDPDRPRSVAKAYAEMPVIIRFPRL